MALSSQQTQEIQKQYDPMRARLQRQESANLQGQRDVIARRAGAGGAPGGAMIKQEQIAADQSARRLQEANEGVDAQQQGALNQARQVQEQRDWQTGERISGQKFASGESALQRRFTSGEAAQQRKFLTGERLGSQEFAGAQAQDAYERQKALARRQMEFAASESRKGRELQQSQFGQQLDRDLARFKHEQFIDGENLKIAREMLRKKDVLEQLFSNFSMDNIGSMFGATGFSGGGGSGGGGNMPQQILGNIANPSSWGF